MYTDKGALAPNVRSLEVETQVQTSQREVNLPPVRVESLDSKLGGEEMGWGRGLQNKASTAWLRCCNKYRIPVSEKRETDSLCTWPARDRSRRAGGSKPKALWGPGSFASLLRASLGCWLVWRRLDPRRRPAYKRQKGGRGSRRSLGAQNWNLIPTRENLLLSL